MRQGVKLGRVVGGLLGVATLGGNVVNGKVRLSEERTGLVCGLHWRFYILFWFFWIGWFELKIFLFRNVVVCSGAMVCARVHLAERK